MRKLYRGVNNSFLSEDNNEDETVSLFDEAPTKNRVPENITIRHEDAILFLKSIPDASVDLVFADPPYFLSNGGTTCKSGKRASVNKGVWDRSHGAENDHEFFVQWLAECKRILKPSGTIFVSGTYHCIYSIGFAMQKLGFHTLNDICWKKPNGSPNLSGRMFAAKHETIIWAAPEKGKKLLHTFNYEALKSKHRVYRCCGQSFSLKSRFCSNCGKKLLEDSIELRQPTSVWEIPTPLPCEKLRGKHSTQKPLRLLKEILESCTNPGDVVVDPFMGGGTTPVACAIMGRSCLASDNDIKSIELANLRLENLSDVKEIFSEYTI